MFGDATHAVAAARGRVGGVRYRRVVGLGTYSRGVFAREVRAAAKTYGIEPLITDDYLEVEDRIAELQPELVAGLRQMERHIAKRFRHSVRGDLRAGASSRTSPARYAPQMGYRRGAKSSGDLPGSTR